MLRGKILPSDVRVNVDMLDKRVSIFGIDPVGFSFSSEERFSKNYSDLVSSFDLDDLDDIVAWAYNLGYENGVKEGTNA